MKIVIPTAGFGTRLRPHTWSKPKPLVTVAGKPVLGHVLDMFGSLPTLDEVVIIVGYLGDQIERYVDSAYPALKTRYIEQEEMLGQSGVVRKTAGFRGRSTVEVRGEIWWCRSRHRLEKGMEVRVTGVDDMILLVEPADNYGEVV